MPPVTMLNSRPQLPELIQASWRRCRHAGMSSHWHIEQSPLSDGELHLQQEHNRQLRKLALREMQTLAASLENTGRILLLSDANGVILDSMGDHDFLGRARRVSLMPGASWREQLTGTNAIGTAILERRFVSVLGSQHYLDENRFLACNAMPILSPDGHLAGVLDISGNAADSLQHTSRLVRCAVAHIEHEWVAESATDVVVSMHQHPSWLGTPEEGILTFDDGLLTGASSRALSCLNLTTAAVGHAQWYDLFDAPIAYGRTQLRLKHTAGFVYADVTRASTAAACIAATESAHSGPENFDDLKDEALRRALAAANGNVSEAARKLGVHRSTFYRRLKQSN